MSPPRNVQALLDRLQALDQEIAEHRTALEVDDELTDQEREGHRVSLGMLLFARAKTETQLRQSGYRTDAPTQELP